MNINEQPHKIEGKQVWYFNGEKWLIRETCKTKKEAEKLLKEIEESKL
jgi:hypothetical protein